MKEQNDLLSELAKKDLERYNVPFDKNTAYTIRIYSKLKTIIDETLDIQHYFDFNREGDMKENLTLEVYHLCEALEIAKRELIDYAIENQFDSFIKSKKL